MAVEATNAAAAMQRRKAIVAMLVEVLRNWYYCINEGGWTIMVSREVWRETSFDSDRPVGRHRIQPQLTMVRER